jgi:hypothetical protein
MVANGKVNFMRIARVPALFNNTSEEQRDLGIEEPNFLANLYINMDEVEAFNSTADHKGIVLYMKSGQIWNVEITDQKMIELLYSVPVKSVTNPLLRLANTAANVIGKLGIKLKSFKDKHTHKQLKP